MSGKLKHVKPTQDPVSTVAPTPPVQEPAIVSELPEKWLLQLKESLKQDNKKMFWATVAGSSVIAATLTILSSFGLEGYKARLNHNLEKYKVELQQQNKVRNESYEAYLLLSQQVDKLDEILEEYILTCLAAAKQPGNTELIEAAKASWDILSDQIGNVTNAKNNTKINPKLADEIDKVTGSLTQNLQTAHKAPHNNPALANRQKELKDSIHAIKKRLQETKDSLVLNS